MSNPYAVVSDRHFHQWSAFSTITADGVNSRLALQLQEMRRVATTLAAEGGSVIVDCGDTFHVRGSVAPSVLNPVMDLHRQLVHEGFTIVSLAGNHDLEGRHSERVSNAVTALESVGVHVPHKAFVSGDFAYVPWIADGKELRTQIERIAENLKSGPLDLFLHAPLNGVIPGIPDHGLDPAWLAKFGFRRVFCGHFHNHKVFPGNVYSVGALTHQTWSDAGSKAGFLIAYDDGSVQYHASRAPSFIDLNASKVDPAELPLLVDGHYVRVKVETSDPKEIDDIRRTLESHGALGVIVNAVRTAAVSARTSSIAAGASLEVSIADFVRGKSFPNEADVLSACQSIMAEVRAAA